MSAGRLILIRHGQTTANVARALDTALPGAPLTDLGVIQARRLGGVLAPVAGGLAEVVTSHALRARQTGAGAVGGLHRIAGPGVRLRHAAGLQEVAAGELEGRADREAHRIFLEIFHAWTHGEPGARVPGGETAAEVLARWRAAVAAAVAAAPPGGVAAVVGHGAAMRLAAQDLAGVAGDFVFTHPVPNTGRIELVREGAGWRAADWAGAQP